MFQTIVLPLWKFVDRIYYQCNRLQLIDMDKENIFRVRLTTYKGYPLETSDGEMLLPGDKLLKIHLYNYHLMKEMAGIESDVRRALYVYERVEKSLPGLAAYLRQHLHEEQIKGIIGVSLLNRGVKKLGFDTFEIKSGWYRVWKESYLKPMYYLCHRQAAPYQKNKLAPTYLVMSKNRLYRSYLR